MLDAVEGAGAHAGCLPSSIFAAMRALHEALGSLHTPAMELGPAGTALAEAVAMEESALLETARLTAERAASTLGNPPDAARTQRQDVRHGPECAEPGSRSTVLGSHDSAAAVGEVALVAAAASPGFSCPCKGKGGWQRGTRGRQNQPLLMVGELTRTGNAALHCAPRTVARRPRTSPESSVLRRRVRHHAVRGVGEDTTRLAQEARRPRPAAVRFGEAENPGPDNVRPLCGRGVRCARPGVTGSAAFAMWRFRRVITCDAAAVASRRCASPAIQRRL
ncbi:hypothetical protein N9L68_05925 [bacterium]|nr:hypothetical protein [bacterium]